MDYDIIALSARSPTGKTVRYALRKHPTVELIAQNSSGILDVSGSRYYAKILDDDAFDQAVHDIRSMKEL